jgi:hypothetical protein
MELNLSRTRTIGEVKQEFATFFPYLKLEFFSGSPEDEAIPSVQEQLNDNLPLQKIQTFRCERNLSFGPAMTVEGFENLLHNDFGLAVHIFSKSGGMWLETFNTGHLSLEKQNSMGEAASRPLRLNWATLFL